MDQSPTSTYRDDLKADVKREDGDEDKHDSSNVDVTAKAAAEGEEGNLGKPLSASWREEPLSSEEMAKVTQILQACRDHDRERLITLAATHGGFVEDHVRRLAWPVLLDNERPIAGSTNWKDLPPHGDEGQVELDVHRAFVYYPTGETDTQIDERKGELSAVITETLRRHPSLCYFQGYHDIAQVLLLVLGCADAGPLLARVSLLKIRDFMLPSISATSSHLELLPAILYAVDPVLCKHLSGLQPFFALAATLTLYAHDIEEYGGISRLFDFLLAKEAVVSVYMYATIIMTRKDELLAIEADEPEMLYHILSKLPKPLDIDDLVTRTVALFSKHPPETLPFKAWAKVSSYSVLKTTRDPELLAKQSLEEGEILLKKHAAEIERDEARKLMIDRTRALVRKYRKPATAVTLAVIVGVLSIWLGQNTLPSTSMLGILLSARQRFYRVIGSVIDVL